jgi:dienelactone hydrolase
MPNAPLLAASSLVLSCAFAVGAQSPGVTPEMIRTALPLEGAPHAVHGPYDVMAEPAFGSPRHVVYRPEDLRAFPYEDSLPVLIWGNGGCAMNSTNYRGFLTTVASHGFVAVATAVIEGEETRRANAADLKQGLDWVMAENERAESPLVGKISTDRVAVMGTSCGGFMSIELGSDPRVDTIGVFNSGVQEAARADRSPQAPTPDTLTALHGPVLLVNGHTRDFLMDESQDTFARLNHVPVFYGARHNAGHTATIFHPGGGEWGNVAVQWLKFVLKTDEKAAGTFVGPSCGLCTSDTWDTDAKQLDFTSIQTADTERVVLRHLEASAAGDASVVRRDYARDAVVIFGGEPSTGIDAVQKVFDDLYARTALDLDYKTRAFAGNVGYVVWTMGALTGSDTFVVRDGKIVAQTGVVVRQE